MRGVFEQTRGLGLLSLEALVLREEGPVVG